MKIDPEIKMYWIGVAVFIGGGAALLTFMIYGL
jgi:hypothetical protein